MPEWLSPLLVFGGIVVGFLGSLLGHRVAAGKNKNDLQQAMIDQIQEERNRLDGQLKEQREYHDKQMAEQQERHDKAIRDMNVRITGFYADKSHSRRYIVDLETDNAALRTHIIRELPPPPPTDIPKPPPGYIP